MECASFLTKEAKSAMEILGTKFGNAEERVLSIKNADEMLSSERWKWNLKEFLTISVHSILSPFRGNIPHGWLDIQPVPSI